MLVEFLARLFGSAQGADENAPPQFVRLAHPVSDRPDRPAKFGRSSNWLVVRTDDPQAVADALGLEDVQASNWASGLKMTQEMSAAGFGQLAINPAAFVTPAIDGWVAVTTRHLGPVDELSVVEVEEVLEKLSMSFGEAQYFGAFPGAAYIAWYRARDGKLTRGLTYVGQGDGFLDNFGETTPEELELGFGDLTGRAPEEMQDLSPAEDDHLRVADLWSFNPDQLEDREDLDKSTGLLGYFPEP